MENIVSLLTNGATEFTPEVLVSLIVFVLVLECIGSIAYSILSVGRR
jgi:hypothetical protein